MVNLNRHIRNVNIGNTDTSHFTINLGKKRYELSNHLGNVLSVISDKPIPHDDGSGNADYWQADILSSYDYSPFGVMLTGRTFEKEKLVQVCHDSTTLTTLTVLNENFSSWFTWTTMGSALLTYVDGEMQVSNPNNSKQNIGASKTFTTGSGVHSVSFDIIDNTCATVVLWPPSVTPKTINVYIRDNTNNVVASGAYTTAGNYSLSFTPTSSGLTYKMEFYMTSASAFCYYRIDDVLITYQSEQITQVCEDVSKKGKYRYAFQNQERDDEIKGRGNSYNYTYRMHDSRLGRFFAVDPLARNYPYNSPYAFGENRVIDGIELEGLEWENIKLESGKQIAIQVTINFEIDNVPEGYSIEDYKIAIQNQFNKTITLSSNGLLKGIIKFDNNADEDNTGRMVPSILLTSEPAKCFGAYEVGGHTIYELSFISIVGSNGAVKSPEDVARTIIHELLHTANFGHPFEDKETQDTEVLPLGNNNYATTYQTAPNLIRNIMWYSFKTVDGEYPNPKEMNIISPGQVDYLINEIDKQEQGAGVGGFSKKEEYYGGGN